MFTTLCYMSFHAKLFAEGNVIQDLYTASLFEL
jgi:hypothetical protein